MKYVWYTIVPASKMHEYNDSYDGVEARVPLRSSSTSTCSSMLGKLVSIGQYRAQ